MGSEWGRVYVLGITEPNVKLYVFIRVLYEFTLKGLGCTVPLRDSDVQGWKDRDPSHTFSAFATPSGTNLHNTVADSNHRLASLNWVALWKSTEKCVSLWSDTGDEYADSRMKSSCRQWKVENGRMRTGGWYELQTFYTGVVRRPKEPLALFDRVILGDSTISQGIRIRTRKASEKWRCFPQLDTLRNDNHNTHTTNPLG